MGTPAGLVLPMRRTLRFAALGAVTLLVVAIPVGWVIAGMPGVWAALLGVAIPVLFLGITAAVALFTARLSPSTLGAAVLGSWLLKIVVLLLALIALDGRDFYSRGVFFVVFLLGTAGFLVVEALVVVRTKVPYVEPSDAPVSPAGSS
jgi:hypothetical protein